ncbi:proenkephalin b isoform X2 [Myxocyprinus asiaticus]|uniref:proenkephalin b isoform X2 n=1 Tax=Myxocyprinus asiaticus TaxID=70543 RepID=UPI0022223DDD|nr:proenkephalin b isoform X2 [Myxocyprinus asiaticus]
MKPLTVPVSSRWMLLLLLSAYLTLTAGADCGTDCAHCSECVLQCEEHLNAGSSWSLCKRFVQNADNVPESNQASTETKHLDPQQHQVEKKYGGFMKRYGGFMKRYGGFMKRYGGFMKRTAELYGQEPEDMDQGRVILPNHDVEMLANQVEADGEREEAALRDILDSKGGVEGVKGTAKRYGGFMKRAGLYDSESEVRPLQKRYGGFMRRVGLPEWWQENKRYGGFLKRSPEENDDEYSLEIKKRYGGFMGY